MSNSFLGFFFNLFTKRRLNYMFFYLFLQMRTNINVIKTRKSDEKKFRKNKPAHIYHVVFHLNVDMMVIFRQTEK